METFKASVEDVEDKHFIKVQAEGGDVLIPLSEDNPNEVKNAFNQIILQMKAGEFQIRLEDVGEDLFSQVAKEYITQLNREIQEVYGEMKKYGLVEPDTNKD